MSRVRLSGTRRHRAVLCAVRGQGAYLTRHEKLIDMLKKKEAAKAEEEEEDEKRIVYM